MKNPFVLVLVVNLFIAGTIHSQLPPIFTGGTPKSIEKDSRIRLYLSPERIVWQSDKSGKYIIDEANLLKQGKGQAELINKGLATLKSDANVKPGILLDFGKELHGGLQIVTGMMTKNTPVNFRYYLSNDEWVIRKHGQLLSDAGEDVIIFDATNTHIYLPQVSKIAETFRAMRKERKSTPSFAFIVNTKPVQTVNRLYINLYNKGLFKDLRFYWRRKPLFLAPVEGQNQEIKNLFSIRQPWTWSKGYEWFGDDRDKWIKIDHIAQSYGWHDSFNKNSNET